MGVEILIRSKIREITIILSLYLCFLTNVTHGIEVTYEAYPDLNFNGYPNGGLQRSSQFQCRRGRPPEMSSLCADLPNSDHYGISPKVLRVPCRFSAHSIS